MLFKTVADNDCMKNRQPTQPFQGDHWHSGGANAEGCDAGRTDKKVAGLAFAIA